jgi:hypothetical protein
MMFREHPQGAGPLVGGRIWVRVGRTCALGPGQVDRMG